MKNLADSAIQLTAYQADLHIHTCLSPCGDWEMSPTGIVEAAIAAKLDIIAICDHNCAENTSAVIRAAQTMDTPLYVIPGLEICSTEEVHILGLFETTRLAFKMQDFCFDHLHGENHPEIFGYQVMANEKNEVRGECIKPLIQATELSLSKIIAKIHDLGGLAVASHINRPAFGILGQLGFIPDNLPLDGLEIIPKQSLAKTEKKAINKPLIGQSKVTGPEKTGSNVAGIHQNVPVIYSSDAHYLEDIGKRRSIFYLSRPEFKEIRLAFAGQNGRKTGG